MRHTLYKLKCTNPHHLPYVDPHLPYVDPQDINTNKMCKDFHAVFSSLIMNHVLIKFPRRRANELFSQKEEEKKKEKNIGSTEWLQKLHVKDVILITKYTCALLISF